MNLTRTAALLTALSALALAGCSSGSGSSSTPTPVPTTASASESPNPSSAQARYPDVVKAVASSTGDGTWTFNVTMSSPYDSPERYADGWRVQGGDRVFGEMTLGHDHASEQPFTRTQTGVKIPSEITSVTVQGRDLKNGYGGGVTEVDLRR